MTWRSGSLWLCPIKKRWLQGLAARRRPKRRKEAKVHMTDKATHKIAVVNMDWDHIELVDLDRVMTSRIPEGGRVLSVSLHPSQFGLDCMYAEEDSSDLKIENNKLRMRQRLYYAVVVCDSSATALHLYRTFDGTKFLETENVFDLRFISDKFRIPPRDVASQAPPSYNSIFRKWPGSQHGKCRAVAIFHKGAEFDEFPKRIRSYEDLPIIKGPIDLHNRSARKQDK